MADFLLYTIIGTAAGFLNTVAGGGSLITLPVLIFMGLPASVANATARVGILVQNLFAVGGFHSKAVKLPFPYVLFLSLASLAGGYVGARLAIATPDGAFNKIIAVVMVLVVLSIVLDRKPKVEGTETIGPKRQALGTLGFFLLGIYGGFIQAGIGFLVIALLTQLHHYPLAKTNYIKVFAAIVYTGVAVTMFAYAGKILWREGLMLAGGHALGAWFGSRWSVTAGDIWIKRILVATVTVLAIKLWFF